MQCNHLRTQGILAIYSELYDQDAFSVCLGFALRKVFLMAILLAVPRAEVLLVLFQWFWLALL